ncbi:MAG: hypothetical protein LBT05_12835 [Planctomycetaceae bacterium]|nr:hypothetical protein [Planctomycetaceae bacterium]
MRREVLVLEDARPLASAKKLRILLETISVYQYNIFLSSGNFHSNGARR